MNVDKIKSLLAEISAELDGEESEDDDMEDNTSEVESEEDPMEEGTDEKKVSSKGPKRMEMMIALMGKRKKK